MIRHGQRPVMPQNNLDQASFLLIKSIPLATKISSGKEHSHDLLALLRLVLRFS